MRCNFRENFSKAIIVRKVQWKPVHCVSLRQLFPVSWFAVHIDFIICADLLWIIYLSQYFHGKYEIILSQRTMQNYTKSSSLVSRINIHLFSHPWISKYRQLITTFINSVDGGTYVVHIILMITVQVSLSKNLWRSDRAPFLTLSITGGKGNKFGGRESTVSGMGWGLNWCVIFVIVATKIKEENGENEDDC